MGATSREEIESALPAWREAAARADVEEETSRSLASVPPGAEVIVYLGTWCGDSRREIARLFRALELVPEPYPFTVSWIGVDRAKTAPGHTEGADVRFVPTIVVRRDGAEVGRIVESAPRGVERELLDLLTGATQGVISARTDL
ncbi:MAG: thioredoxin family protein [Myxococcota bacterium]|nr:thioredoxin family protein [Myxococcota bacterium]